jgi:hypothetical protein
LVPKYTFTAWAGDTPDADTARNAARKMRGNSATRVEDEEVEDREAERADAENTACLDMHAPPDRHRPVIALACGDV